MKEMSQKCVLRPSANNKFLLPHSHLLYFFPNIVSRTSWYQLRIHWNIQLRSLAMDKKIYKKLMRQASINALIDVTAQFRNFNHSSTPVSIGAVLPLQTLTRLKSSPVATRINKTRPTWPSRKRKIIRYISKKNSA